MVLLNLVWPALFVSNELWEFWVLVLGTILIETFTIKALLSYTFQRSFYASTLGNIVSGLAGVFLMPWVMLVWHFSVDAFMPDATFGQLNWIATYCLMCIGSVFIETLVVHLVFKTSIKHLFLPLLIGNVVTYCFIAYNTSIKEQEKKKGWTDHVYYSPVANSFDLLDSTKLVIYTAKCEVEYDRNDSVLNERYPLEILFEKDSPEHYQFDLKLPGEKHSGGIESGRKILRLYELRDSIDVLLLQKNPDPNIGWQAPVVTDTIWFVKRKRE